MVLKEYAVVGRRMPHKNDVNPTLYRMRIFAHNAQQAESRFWYFMGRLKKVKSASGQIVSVNRIHEKKPGLVKNFGVWLRYDSRSGTHNMYKEYRATTLASAVQSMYAEMAGRHRARFRSIHIIRVGQIPASSAQRPAIKEFHDASIAFPAVGRFARARKPHRSNATVFKAARPSVPV